MTRNEVGCGVVVDVLGEPTRLLILPLVQPFGEYVFVV